MVNTNARRSLLALGLAGLLGACRTAPAPAPGAPGRAERVAALQGMGFVPVDDGWELNLGVKLLFASDVDVLSPEGGTAIDAVARSLKSVGIERVTVEGHTDNVGSARHNEMLSLRRAESVARQLVRAGLRDEAIQRRGFGFTKPIADNATPEGRAQNRRVVVTVGVD